jgi:hypothetical protein
MSIGNFMSGVGESLSRGVGQMYQALTSSCRVDDAVDDAVGRIAVAALDPAADPAAPPVGGRGVLERDGMNGELARVAADVLADPAADDPAADDPAADGPAADGPAAGPLAAPLDRREVLERDGINVDRMNTLRDTKCGTATVTVAADLVGLESVYALTQDKDMEVFVRNYGMTVQVAKDRKQTIKSAENCANFHQELVGRGDLNHGVSTKFGAYVGQSLEGMKNILEQPCWNFAVAGGTDRVLGASEPRPAALAGAINPRLLGEIMKDIPGDTIEAKLACDHSTIEADGQKFPTAKKEIPEGVKASLRANSAKINQIIASINTAQANGDNNLLYSAKTEILKVALSGYGFDVAEEGEETPYAICMHGKRGEIYTEHYGVEVSEDGANVHAFQTLPNYGVGHSKKTFEASCSKYAAHDFHRVAVRNLPEAVREPIAMLTEYGPLPR